eukprot:scaffold247690_cov19-Tisochrysis_lutea.AAC.1
MILCGTTWHVEVKEAVTYTHTHLAHQREEANQREGDCQEEHEVLCHCRADAHEAPHSAMRAHLSNIADAGEDACHLWTKGW